MLKKKHSTDTIAALATPPGRGGVSIIRISGSKVSSIAHALLNKFPQPRYANFRLFLDEEGQAIDEGIALFFPAPHSFTGEDVLEIQGHGSPIVIHVLLKRICQLGARLAEPGEFSERAFLNNKMDLTQAEAIADLIEASSEQAARASMRSLQGEFSKKIHRMVKALIQLRTYIEAAIDFVEEEINFLANSHIALQLKEITEEVQCIKMSATSGSLLQEGITAVITGRPNVGKSSLLNCLSGKDIAIVTDIPGTTRDLLRENILIDDLPIHFIDTAGLRESKDPVEQEGIRRAREEISRADLILYLIDHDQEKINQEDFPSHIPFVIVRNKIDLTQEPATLFQKDNKVTITLSAKEQTGLSLLKEHIKTLAGFKITQSTFSARQRHLDALDKAHQFLTDAHYHLHDEKAYELLAEDLRQTQYALNEITGEFTTEDLLSKIFSSFCIGK